MEEIDVLKNIKFGSGSNGVTKEGDLLSEIIKVRNSIVLYDTRKIFLENDKVEKSVLAIFCLKIYAREKKNLNAFHF